MIDSKYTKQALTVDDQLDVLRGRGLIIDNYEEAKEALEKTSYFRLSGYWSIMERDHKKHVFRPNSKFSTVVDYYNFDKELKLLIFSAIQIIEVALRTKMIKHFGSEPFWFMFREYAINADHFQENYERIEKEVKRSRERFIVEHFQKYAQPELPPVWKTLEVLSFGTLSRLYSNFKDSTAKQNVAKEFGLTHFKILRSWLECITILRNCSAHHLRVFNRVFPVEPIIPHNAPEIWKSHKYRSNSLYPHLCLIDFWLKAIDVNSNFMEKFYILLSKYPTISIRLMGFPQQNN